MSTLNYAEDRQNELLSEFDVEKVSEVKADRLVSKSRGRIFRMQVLERTPNGEYYLGTWYVQGSELATLIGVILSWQQCECSSANEDDCRLLKIIDVERD